MTFHGGKGAVFTVWIVISIFGASAWLIWRAEERRLVCEAGTCERGKAARVMMGHCVCVEVPR